MRRRVAVIRPRVQRIGRGLADLPADYIHAGDRIKFQAEVDVQGITGPLYDFFPDKAARQIEGLMYQTGAFTDVVASYDRPWFVYGTLTVEATAAVDFSHKRDVENLITGLVNTESHLTVKRVTVHADVVRKARGFEQSGAPVTGESVSDQAARDAAARDAGKTVGDAIDNFLKGLKLPSATTIAVGALAVWLGLEILKTPRRR